MYETPFKNNGDIIFTISTGAGFLNFINSPDLKDTKPEASDQHVSGHVLMHPHPSEPENGSRLPSLKHLKLRRSGFLLGSHHLFRCEL